MLRGERRNTQAGTVEGGFHILQKGPRPWLPPRGPSPTPGCPLGLCGNSAVSAHSRTGSGRGQARGCSPFAPRSNWTFLDGKKAEVRGQRFASLRPPILSAGAPQTSLLRCRLGADLNELGSLQSAMVCVSQDTTVGRRVPAGVRLSDVHP